MSTLSTHVLDLSTGRPASGVRVLLETRRGSEWVRIGSALTDVDGRVRELSDAGRALDKGTYRLTFETAAYFAQRGDTCFYPHVDVTFVLDDAGRHYHVPLLVSQYGYSTYRGS